MPIAKDISTMQEFLADFMSYTSSPMTWFHFVLGACIGSFLNVCIYRLPRDCFFKDSRSFCPACQKHIPLWWNIPIVSWLILRGRSRCCQTTIPLWYPSVELLTALAWAFIYWRFPYFESWQPEIVVDSASLLRYVHASVFVSLLITCSVIDLHHMIIPDKISIPMILLSPLIVVIHPELTLTSSLLGIFLGGGVLYGIAWLYYLFRRDIGLGLGDVKLLAAIGGWLGYQSLFTTVFVGSVLGALVGIIVMIVTRSPSMKLKIPFGPFLSLGAVVYLLFGQKVQEWLLLGSS
jgi:leader peptidase (prepilin peptidase)/N-methyltransferase